MTIEKNASSNRNKRRFGVLYHDPERVANEAYDQYISDWVRRGKRGVPDPYEIAPDLYCRDYYPDLDPINENGDPIFVPDPDGEEVPANLYRALEFAVKGYAVFPLYGTCGAKPEFAKIPVKGKNNGNNGHTDYRDIVRAWGYSCFGIGLAMRGKVFVLDFDGEKGRADKAKLEEKIGCKLEDICPYYVRTPNGLQFYFAAPKDGYHYQSTNHILFWGVKTNIDTRCNEGAYVVAAGSIGYIKNKNGNYTEKQRKYEAVGELPYIDDLPQLPESIRELLPRTPILLAEQSTATDTTTDTDYTAIIEAAKDENGKWKINYPDEAWERFCHFADANQNSHIYEDEIVEDEDGTRRKKVMEGIQKSMCVVSFALYELDLDEEQARCLLFRWGDSLDHKWGQVKILKKIEYVKKNNRLYGSHSLALADMAEMRDNDLIAYYREQAEREEAEADGDYRDDAEETAEMPSESIVETDATNDTEEPESSSESITDLVPPITDQPKNLEELALEGLSDDVRGFIRSRHSNLSMSATLLGSLVTVGSQISSTYLLDGDPNNPILLHGLIVAPSGYGKSELCKKLVAPVKTLQAGYDTENALKEERFEDEMAEYREAKKQKGEEKTTPKKPKKPCYPMAYMTVGGTVQGLKTRLTQIQRHTKNVCPTLCHAEESGGFFAKLETGKINQQDISDWTTALNGGDFHDLLTEKTYNCTVNIGFLGEIQTKRLLNIFRGGNDLLDQGLFSRWLYTVEKPIDEVKYLDHRYGEILTPTDPTKDPAYIFIKAIRNAPKQIYRLSEDAIPIHQAYSRRVSEYRYNHRNDTQLHQQFLMSIISHSQKRVMSVASIVHIMNVAVGVIDGTDTWENVEITGDEMTFAVRFVLHYHQQLINFLASVGWSNGLTSSKPEWQGVIRLLRFLKKEEEKKRKGTKHLPYVTRTDISRNVRIGSAKMTKEYRDKVIDEAIDQQLVEEVEFDIKDKKIKVLQLTPAGNKRI